MHAEVSFDQFRSSTARRYTYRIPDGCTVDVGDTVVVESLKGIMFEHSDCEFVSLGYVVRLNPSYTEDPNIKYRKVVGVVKPLC